MRRQAAYTRFTMLDETVTPRLPGELHHRLVAAATATRRSLEEILLHALRIGSPPAWDDAPPEHQAELAAMDRLDDCCAVEASAGPQVGGRDGAIRRTARAECRRSARRCGALRVGDAQARGRSVHAHQGARRCPPALARSRRTRPIADSQDHVDPDSGVCAHADPPGGRGRGDGSR